MWPFIGGFESLGIILKLVLVRLRSIRRNWWICPASRWYWTPRLGTKEEAAFGIILDDIVLLRLVISVEGMVINCTFLAYDIPIRSYAQ